MSWNASSLFVIAVLCTAANANAQDAPESVTLHGFGGWAYGKTNDNNYLAGIPDGDYRHTSMALNLAARVDERLSIHAQGEMREDDDATHTTLSYAFADYRVTDHLSLHFGQVKEPFGISTEVLTVGTLRPFLDLPQSVYGPVGFAGESFKGVGLSGTVGEGQWITNYDLYAGGSDLLKLAVPEQFYHGNALQDVGKEAELQSMRDVVGARVVFHPPVVGLRFGFSSYTGIVDEALDHRGTVVGAQLQYNTNTFDLRSEVAHLHQVADEFATGAYVQAAYRVTERWQLAAQYDHLDDRIQGVNTASAPSLQFHREGAVALNYWISRSLVIKSEFHVVRGNRLAMPDPESLVGTVSAGQLRTTTRLVQFGAQFTF